MLITSIPGILGVALAARSDWKVRLQVADIYLTAIPGASL
jgi:hypothetical protein